MATILLQAAGAFLGGALGPVGAALGTAAGAMVGYTIDRALIDGLRHDKGPRLTGSRPFSAEEGGGLPRVYGTMRIGGAMIWATRFEENATTERQGGKGGARSTTYSYYGNVAFALCEGPIAGIRRVWADGREIDLEGVTCRVYNGAETQERDPLILARQGDGNTPAYRGTAYAVLERLPLGPYGNRIPQFQFEVMRPVGMLRHQLKAVTLLPGSSEYGLSPDEVRREISAGESVAANRHVLHAQSDIVAALDELQALCPQLEHVGLIVTWFGNDLRAGMCTIRPRVVSAADGGHSASWSVNGVSRGQAIPVSHANGSPAYGGTPSDDSVVAAIAHIRARGWKVTLYPFVMMDIPAGNGLPDPHGAAEQPAYPWRGRITCMPAPGRPGSPDKTPWAGNEIGAFCGQVSTGDFAIGSGTATYSGDPDDWGYRRMVLHYAALAAAAGGVDAFLIGSELKGLTAVRDGAASFPFVAALASLAADVRALLGPYTRITYGADWSEYAGYTPDDGSGDRLFHLDYLWAHPAIDAVGIDNYMPLADWRDQDYVYGNPDGLKGPSDAGGLAAAIAGGEGYDWYYASDEDRQTRTRSPITDGAYGIPWVHRVKDLAGWWSNWHRDRIGGVEIPTPTVWQPASKPIWFTELGCPAVDKGPNQPNVFPDPKSSENALPHHSSGGRDDSAQHAFLLSHLMYWDPAAPGFEEARNPVSPVYGGRMVDPSRIYGWTWDARPYPAYPLRQDIWSDGGNWLRGHWLNGRLSGVEAGELVAHVAMEHGLGTIVDGSVSGSLDGFVIPEPATCRAALEPLLTLFGLVADGGGPYLQLHRPLSSSAMPLGDDDVVQPQDGPAIRRVRLADHDLPSEAVLAFADAWRDYQSATARMAVPDAPHASQEFIQLPAAMPTQQADALLAEWMRRRWSGREQVELALPAGRIDVKPGSVVRLQQGGRELTYAITSVESGAVRALTGRQIATSRPAPWQPALPPDAVKPGISAGAPHVLALDLPLTGGASVPENQLRLAVRSVPWRRQAVLAAIGGGEFERRATLTAGATMGALTSPLAPGREGLRNRADIIQVDLLSGALASVTDEMLLAGANVAAVRALTGEWEIIQFQHAEEIAPAKWRLWTVLRGEAGSEPAMRAGAAAGADFVLLDGAVVSAGLRSGEAGLTVSWRVGPIGAELGSGAFQAFSQAGGMRARRPLAPVHLKARPRDDGGLFVDWQRRSRLNGARAISGVLPLGETIEAYEVVVTTMEGAELRRASVAEARWHYPAAHLAGDVPMRPAGIEIAVAQVSGEVGSGDFAKLALGLS